MTFRRKTVLGHISLCTRKSLEFLVVPALLLTLSSIGLSCTKSTAQRPDGFIGTWKGPIPTEFGILYHEITLSPDSTATECMLVPGEKDLTCMNVGRWTISKGRYTDTGEWYTSAQIPGSGSALFAISSESVSYRDRLDHTARLERK